VDALQAERGSATHAAFALLVDALDGVAEGDPDRGAIRSCCSLHPDPTRDLYINRGGTRFQCFSCGAGGDRLACRTSWRIPPGSWRNRRCETLNGNAPLGRRSDRTAGAYVAIRAAVGALRRHDDHRSIDRTTFLTLGLSAWMMASKASRRSEKVAAPSTGWTST